MKEPKCIDNMLVREVNRNPWNAINVPVCFSSTYEFDSIISAENTFKGISENYCYSRLGNPTVVSFEEKMTEIESGYNSVAFGSGMAAIAAVILALCKPGDLIICVDEIYGGTHKLLRTVVQDLGIRTYTFGPDLSNFPLNPLTVKKTKLVFVETPTNPSLHTIDLDDLMGYVGLLEDAYVCVDNTFATTCFQQPIYQNNVDMVLHSATKYIGGHGDLLGGIVTVSNQSPHLTEALKNVRTSVGGIMDPMTAFLCLRGLKTLGVRMRQHTINALTLGSLFDDLDLNYKYPGFGGMISLDLENRDNASRFIKLLIKETPFAPKLAVSLGETQTLLNVPALMTHSTYSEYELKNIGISPGLIRISVGLENPLELKAEFKRALKDI